MRGYLVRLIWTLVVILVIVAVAQINKKNTNSRACSRSTAACDKFAEEATNRKMPCRYIGVWNRSFGNLDERFTLKEDGTYTIDPAGQFTRVRSGKWIIRNDVELIMTDDMQDPPELFYIQAPTLTHFELAQHGGDKWEMTLLEPIKTSNCAL